VHGSGPLAGWHHQTVTHDPPWDAMECPVQPPVDRVACAEADDADPLAPLRAEFALPDSLIYLDGNSLGPLPVRARQRLHDMVETQWAQGLIRSWNDAGWFDEPLTIGDRLAPLVGAAPGEVVVCDSTSVNLFKVLTAALRMRPGRTVVVAEEDAFPTDLYLIEGATELLGGYRRRLVGGNGSDLAGALDDEVAVVVLSHVDYRTGRLHDLAAVTEQVQRCGALVVWDLCHSAGALPVRLNESGADFAVGCTYKYLNGGPGAPAFVFAASRHHHAAHQPLSGWQGHADPFAFVPSYAPAEGIGRFRAGTPPLLSYAPLQASLDVWDEVDLDTVRAKSVRLSELFIALVERECADLGVRVASPRDPARRGSQVALRHDEGYPVMQALIHHGVIGDFRAPDLLRFGFTPLYVRYVDVWDAVHRLREVLRTQQWREPRFAVRGTVT
jgi:kynureninase